MHRSSFVCLVFFLHLNDIAGKTLLNLSENKMRYFVTLTQLLYQQGNVIIPSGLGCCRFMRPFKSFLSFLPVRKRDVECYLKNRCQMSLNRFIRIVKIIW